MKFVPKGPINNVPALVQIMAWRRPGDKTLCEQILVSLQTHIWVTQSQWVQSVLENLTVCSKTWSLSLPLKTKFAHGLALKVSTSWLKNYTSFQQFLFRLRVIPNHLYWSDDIIQNRQDLKKFRDTSNFKQKNNGTFLWYGFRNHIALVDDNTWRQVPKMTTRHRIQWTSVNRIDLLRASHLFSRLTHWYPDKMAPILLIF